jgi:hypothetical protein
MIALLLAVFTQGLGSSPALALSNADLLGQWQYDGFFYDGHRYPNPNPDLDLTFTFNADGTDRLFYARKNESGFCERLADYRLEDEHLVQKITWTNPKNAGECGQDTDMQQGRETDTVLSLTPQELTFHLDLNGLPFLYILKRLPPNP